MQPKREIKKVVKGLEARQAILSGAEQMYNAVSSVYGVGGNNAMLSMPYGFDPVVTRDGVTVAKRVSSTNAGLEDRIENDGARLLYQASEKTNKTAGDGTTATVVLSYHLLNAAHQLVVAGENAMKLKKTIDEDSRVVIDFLKSKSVEATDKQLLDVACVSSGDQNVGKLIANTLKDVGLEGGITVKEQGYPVLEVEKINGYYFEKGCEYVSQRVEWKTPKILVSHKRMSTAQDIIPIIAYVAKLDDPKIIIVGDVSGEALGVLINNTVAQVDSNGRPYPFEALVIPPPEYNEEGRKYLEDIATYTGAKVFMDSYAAEDINDEFFGTAEVAEVSNKQAIFLKGAGDVGQITERAAEIKQLIDDEKQPNMKQGLEKRYSKLVGKIAIINVGSAINAEMEELRARVDDAIEAVKSAMVDGVLPGGATMLARATELPISPLFKKALTATFKDLYENAAEPSDYRFQQILKSPFGHGFNLRKMTDEPIDLSKQGIWDATRSTTQVVENAASAAGTLITINVVVTVVDDVEQIKELS